MKLSLVCLSLVGTLVLIGSLLPPASFAQSLTTGSVTGTVTDPSGAAVPSATVSLRNNDTAAIQNSTTNSTGAYRFALLNPGSYSLSVRASGFRGMQQNVSVAVGQSSTVDLKLEVASTATTVEVTAQGSALQTDNGNVSTTISPEIIATMPNPGNDLSYFVQTSPGATMNTQAGYGNSATYGISATSNLFTIDGMNENDPFLNLNNSGATNLLLGANDIQTATVVNNGYTGEYGTLAGANVNYVTKSGTNRFHGNLEYFWNGSVLNANDWFLNNAGVPRSFDNANQWAASIGGPIKKGKTFFFLNTEGLRLLIPTSQPVNIPSPQFQAATLATIPASEVPFYRQTFNLFNNAPGATGATNSLPAGGCDGTVTLPGGAPCAFKFQSNVNNLTTEWLLTARVDQNIGNSDRVFVHFRTDHGLQASITDPFSPLLNAQSVQPQYEGQLQETHQVGANGVNQFILAGSWYSAVFGPPSLAKATTAAPYDLDFEGQFFTTPGNATFYTTWPQGRNVTQYQISDDYGWLKGAHNLKFGVNFRRNDLTDYTPGGFFSAIPLANIASENSFLTGTVDTFQQGFPTRPTQPLAIYSLGLYAQDEWALRRSFKLTLSLRAQHNSNPVCQTDCFARLAGPFLTSTHDPTQPYNQAIQSGLHQALPDYEPISWEPRLGFAWQPFGLDKTVIRGGFGIFSDVFPGTVATSFDTNSPLKNTFLTTGLLAPGVPGSAQSAAVASNAAFSAGFASGLTFDQIQAALPPGAFSPPAFTNSENNIRYPKYEEWNLEVQQALGQWNSISVNYVGNHGYDLAAENLGLNGYCDPLTCAPSLGATSFGGLPAAPLDTRFSTITEVGNYGVSNYNGLTVSFTRRVSNAFQLQASYTWSHALDDVSNGGFLPFNLGTNTSIINPQHPYCFSCYNYGNADYDARHQANLTYTYHTPKLNNALLNVLANWTISGTLFVRSGLPFTVIDGGDTGTLNGFNYGNFLFADSNVGPFSCSSSAVFNNYVTTTPCMNSSEFTAPLSAAGVFGFGNQRRNQVYGPMYFNTDLRWDEKVDPRSRMALSYR
ncbi:MAG TPA: carboxypeptidase regulatory-like domain-containing protein [Candidatus Sulfotelmatobacter sp.]|nr:carboxypeptidase regulatory-like domain-containing protein [Candidatus Sulfotelmatobacter sp.]